ncbi:MAG: hypothetical protein RIR91_202 [Verrucomicrobiota bacterium]|jgi:hypothetical protein
MSKVRALGRQKADEQFPLRPRGPHHLAREKERRAYLLGFEAGWRLAKAEPNPDPDA